MVRHDLFRGQRAKSVLSNGWNFSNIFPVNYSRWIEKRRRESVQKLFFFGISINHATRQMEKGGHLKKRASSDRYISPRSVADKVLKI